MLVVKNLPANARDRFPSLGQEDPLVEVMATHTSILPRRIPWTEEPDELQSIGSQRVRHNRSNLAHTHTNDKSKQTTKIKNQKVVHSIRLKQ